MRMATKCLDFGPPSPGSVHLPLGCHSHLPAPMTNLLAGFVNVYGYCMESLMEKHQTSLMALSLRQSQIAVLYYNSENANELLWMVAPLEVEFLLIGYPCRCEDVQKVPKNLRSIGKLVRPYSRKTACMDNDEGDLSSPRG
mmetsp:Transcript_13561/g.21817  ORF Transcript_13561/g.21817 Transcript_13561/m.21817 type:complete len:141 (-) Transcript_13561:92-514(-)